MATCGSGPSSTSTVCWVQPISTKPLHAKTEKDRVPKPAMIDKVHEVWFLNTNINDVPSHAATIVTTNHESYLLLWATRFSFHVRLERARDCHMLPPCESANYSILFLPKYRPTRKEQVC